MSIREILQRYARGLPLEAGKVPLYDSEQDLLPELDKMDLADAQEVLEEMRRRSNEILDKYKMEQEELFNAEREKQIADAVEKRLKEREAAVKAESPTEAP